MSNLGPITQRADGGNVPGECDTIGGSVSEVVLAEDPVYNGRYLRSFLRVRVVLDLRKPLACGFWLPRPDGRQVWISTRFKKLQNFCYNCGRVGHENKSCRSKKLMSLVQPSEPHFGAWTATNACRNWDEVMIVVNEIWVEAVSAKKRRDEALIRRRNSEKRQSDKRSPTSDENLFVIKVLNPTTEARGGNLPQNNEEVSVEPSSVKHPRDDWVAPEVERGGRMGGSDRERMKQSALDELNRDSGCYDEFNSTGLDTSGFSGLGGSMSHANINMPNQNEQALTMVVYDGRIMSEVINDLDRLGLKRKAIDMDETEALKRRKLDIVESQMETDIFDYAASLRKTFCHLSHLYMYCRK
ncbi:hypothetical protein K1719_019184 [Acacia pycnantha]|nr:hypothetical protein K1719_019184 [Acacia pycnantha]